MASRSAWHKLGIAVLGTAIAAFVAGAAVLHAGTRQARALRVVRHEFRSPDLPLAFDGKRIVFVADVHHSRAFNAAWVRNVVGRINGLKPDAVLLGGDYVVSDRRYVRPVQAELAAIRAPLGVYAVLGNHDHWVDAAMTRDAIRRAGIRLIENRNERLSIDGQAIVVAGVGDLWEDVQNIGSALRGVRARDFCVLVSHNPDYFEGLRDPRVDLALAGHTHGGQVSVFGLYAPELPSKYGQKYRYGWVAGLPYPVYVTCGVGTSPPYRLFTTPEIVLLTLRRGARPGQSPQPPSSLSSSPGPNGFPASASSSPAGGSSSAAESSSAGAVSSGQ
jgi:predicted MPP superfamily phosphohydrolase